MNRFSINQIVGLTGIPAHTLRKWEMRYTIITPNRTSTNIRFYTNEHLKKLLNVTLLQQQGYKISAIGKMSDQEISTLLAADLTKSGEEKVIQDLILCMMELDEAKFQKIVQPIIVEKGLMYAIINVVYPFLNRVGILWGIDRVLPAQEHFITSLIKQKIFTEIDSLPNPVNSSKKIVFFLLEKEWHELGLLLAYYIAKKMGWKTYYLGQNVPLSNLDAILEQVQPNLLFTLLSTSLANKAFENLKIKLSNSQVELLVSGNKSAAEMNSKNESIKFLDSPNDLIEHLSSFGLS